MRQTARQLVELGPLHDMFANPLKMLNQADPPARRECQDLCHCKCAFQSLVRCLPVPFEPCQQVSCLLSNPRPHGVRHSQLNCTLFFNRAANRPEVLFELPTRLFSIKVDSAGSLSDFTMLSTNSNPISRHHAISLRRVHYPVDFLGTVLTTALIVLSPATNK